MAIELNELHLFKIKRTGLDNTIELLFGYGNQADKYYILEYKKDRSCGSLSPGMTFEQAVQAFENLVQEEADFAKMIDGIDMWK